MPPVVGHFILVFVACYAHAVFCSLDGNNTDRLSLLEFKKAIIGDPQHTLMSWNDSNHYCNWEGILCSRVKHPQRVTSLNLQNKGLAGQISPSLGNLTFLTLLDLSANSLTGEIPPYLGHLHRLQYLALNNNTLQGGVPSLANCSKLKEVWMGYNQLTGQIPADFPHGFQTLELTSNNLTGTIPTCLANITTLNTLDFVYNNIEGNIPDEFAKLSELVYLLVGVNNLSGGFPQAVLNLSNLAYFNLAFNHLSGELPSYFGNSLQNLKVIELGQNFFHGPIPSGLTNASKLQTIDISDNKLTGVVPSSIGKLSGLSMLDLEVNKLQARNKEDWEFMNSLVNCTELQTLSLTENHLEGNVPKSIGNLSNQLQILYLSDNQLTGLFPSGLAKLRSLIAVGLSLNRFVGEVPEWIGTLTNLQLVILNSNLFTGVIPSSFSNMSKLGALDLGSNQFDGHIPPTLGNLQMLGILNISDNNLHGSIPKELFKIQTLRYLGLSSNNLDGPLHIDIGDAKQLANLLISSNKLFGEIPSTLGNCESLEHIELDSNVFSGSIPTSLTNISSIKLINLSHNSLTGSIPVSLGSLPLLEYLDLSFNHLKGEVPTKGIFRNVTAMSIDGNLGLCGGILELHLLSCPVMPLSSTKKKQSIVKKLAIPLASIFSLAIVISVMVLWRRKQNRKFISDPSFGTPFPKVSYNDLARATEKFSASNLIGKGRYSFVYQGKLFQDGTMVAVKVFCLETKGTQRSFIAECNALRNVRHRNLVPILTACSGIDSMGDDFKALVYKYMPLGDLHSLLYSRQADDDTSGPSRVTLAQRLCIVVDVADALEYLHHSNQGTIVHCDLKPSNILLDDNMVAHIGDFGLARFLVDSAASSFIDLTSASSLAIKGTVGYIPPEYATGGDASSAGDVYSFGIILLEIFVRKRPTDDMFKDGLTITRLVEMSIPDRIMHVLDPELLEEEQQTSSALEKNSECLNSVLNIGLCCTNPSPNERMDMREVAARLRGIKEAYLSQN
ncbi:hypothetical protein ACP4OV_014681 [Aristida adscensionis]